VRPAFNEAALPEFLANRFVSTAETFFRGVQKLLPGTCAVLVRGRRAAVAPLLAPAPAPGRMASPTIESAGPVVRGLLESAVRSHLMSGRAAGGVSLGRPRFDVPWPRWWREPSRRPSRRSRSVSPTAEANELDYARLVAEMVGARHREVVVTPEE